MSPKGGVWSHVGCLVFRKLLHGDQACKRPPHGSALLRGDLRPRAERSWVTGSTGFYLHAPVCSPWPPPASSHRLSCSGVSSTWCIRLQVHVTPHTLLCAPQRVSTARAVPCPSHLYVPNYVTQHLVLQESIIMSEDACFIWGPREPPFCLQKPKGENDARNAP